MTLLLCDVGGTHIRFALADHPQKVLIPHKYKVCDFTSLQDALRVFLGGHGFSLNALTHLYLAFSNRNEWNTTPDQLRPHFPNLNVIQVNDFVANAYGIMTAPQEDFHYFRAPQIVKRGDKAYGVIGVGTGLGLAYLFDHGDIRFVQRTHGGHMLPAVLDGMAQKFLNTLKDNKPDKTVPIYEDILSGRGLYDLYKFVCASHDCRVYFDSIDQVMMDGKTDPEFREALKIFTHVLGVFAHHVLAFGHCYDGLYITGGMIDRLMAANLFDFSVFDLGLQQHLHPIVCHDVAETPVAWVRDEFISLRGLAHLAQKDGVYG